MSLESHKAAPRSHGPTAAGQGQSVEAGGWTTLEARVQRVRSLGRGFPVKERYSCERFPPPYLLACGDK